MTDAERQLRYARHALASQRTSLLSLLTSMEGDAALWRPRPDAWNALEIANHLADEERDDFRARLSRTLEDPEAPWEPIDPEGWVTARAYADRDMRASIDRFALERDASLRWLAELEAPDLSKAHRHPTIGAIRAGDLLAAWVAHDLFHIRQLVRLHYRYLTEAFPGFDPGYAGAWGGP